MTDLLLLKEFQQPTQLTNAHPFDKIDMLFKRSIGFARKSRRGNFLYAGFVRRISQQPRINAVSRDDPENV